MLAEKTGVELLLFPCGQFGDQEYDTNEEIKQFVESEDLGDKPNVHVFAKGDVIGAQAHPAWRLLRRRIPFEDDQPGWNFDGKYIISKTGMIQKAPQFGSAEGAIDALLAE